MNKTIPRTAEPVSDGNIDGNGKGDAEFGGATSTSMTEDRLLVPRRRPWRVIVSVALILLLAVIAGFILLRPSNRALTTTARIGTIISTVETTGRLQAENSTRLAFKTSGRVAEVRARPGDRVQAGDVLAELETDTPRRLLEEASIQLEISKLKLQQAKNGASEADVAAARANVDAAKADLDRIKAGATIEDIAGAQAALNQTQARLDQLKKGAAPQEIGIAQAKLDQAKANRDLVASNAANQTEQARITMEQAAEANQNWLDPDGRYEQARLNYEAAKQAEQSQVAIADAQVREAQEGLNKVIAGATLEEIRQAEEAVAQAKANLDKVKRGGTQEEINAAQAKVDAAQAGLDKVMAGPTSTEIEMLEQEIALSQVAVDSANAQIADAQLTTPIAGTVLTSDLEVGETVGGYQQVMTVADIASLRIKADIDELDVGLVSVGQAVTVTLDSYPGVRLPGTIEKLAPGATQKQGSTVYQATVRFSTAEGVVPREGMAASVDVTAQRKDDVLLIPNRAIETVGDRQYVTVQDGGTNRKVEIETGLSNNTDTEVISGLEEGQAVVLR